MSFEVVVVGGGLDGVTAALRARELGATVALVERGNMGGPAPTTAASLPASSPGPPAWYATRSSSPITGSPADRQRWISPGS
jgi:glycine/D-amino acid oxidase-like deaminating enzyme